jgi:hypothetical protein
MQKVEGSNPFIRSISFLRGDVAEWLGTGLQNPLHRFNSGRRLLTSGAVGSQLQFCASVLALAVRRHPVTVAVCRHYTALKQTGNSRSLLAYPTPNLPAHSTGHCAQRNPLLYAVRNDEACRLGT